MQTETLTRKIEEIELDVRRFRACLDRLHNTLGPSFLDFPRGCCGDVSELLAAFLKDCGHGEFEYVSGWSENYEEGSHAWLEFDGFIIDATIDQFSHEALHLMVSRDRTFHEKFSLRKEVRSDGDFRIAGNPRHLLSAYHTVLACLTDDA